MPTVGSRKNGLFSGDHIRITAIQLSSATLAKLLTHMCLCHKAVQFGTSQWTVMPCGWEGNRRSGVALATRHRH